jgi:selenocysteine lyase/cysteine desulfurase
MERRKFLRNTGLGLGLFYVPFSLSEAAGGIAGFDPEKPLLGEFNWETVRKAYNPSPDFINLENGYFSPQTSLGYKNFVSYGERLNRNTSRVMRLEREPEEEKTRNLIAEFCGVDGEEVVLTRNTTESLNMVINGLDFKSGDEAIITDQDYPNMINAFLQREKRDGLRIKEIRIPLNPKTDEEIVSAYEEAITSNTRILLVTHMINLTGQVLPCRKISDMAHSHGVEVLVDAAHSFAHIDFKIPDLKADYLGTSLHKWLCAPLGTGLLYIKKEKIPKVWPLMGDVENEISDIRKFQRQGTQPLGTRHGIRDALEFQKYVGNRRKEERLRGLTTYWTEKARKIKGISVNTPEDPNRYAGLGNFKVEGMNPGPVSKLLFDKHGIMTVPVKTKSVEGVRVTPHLYIEEEQLDALVLALKSI